MKQTQFAGVCEHGNYVIAGVKKKGISWPDEEIFAGRGRKYLIIRVVSLLELIIHTTSIYFSKKPA
jgi:hypothetical protein